MIFESDGNRRRIYISSEGSVYPDFNPEPIWGADMSHYSLMDGYLITALSDKSGHVQMCGVMDLRTVQDVLPPIYDAVELSPSTIWAIKDGEEFLFDYSGQLLMQSEEHKGAYDTKGVGELRDLWNYAKLYRTLYVPVVVHHDGMTLAYATDKGLSVFSDEGQNLFSILNEDIWSYYKDEGKIIVRVKDSDLLIVYPDGQIKLAQLPEEIKKERYNGFSYDDGMLTMISWPCDYTYDTATGVITEIEHLQKEAITWHPLKDERYSDSQASEIFILAYKGDYPFGIFQIDVLNLAGELLLEDVFGVNFTEPSFPDTMVVWLDEDHCVLLDQFGNTTPIPPYTSVKKINMGY
jgi:hypothetical protein